LSDQFGQLFYLVRVVVFRGKIKTDTIGVKQRFDSNSLVPISFQFEPARASAFGHLATMRENFPGNAPIGFDLPHELQISLASSVVRHCLHLSFAIRKPLLEIFAGLVKYRHIKAVDVRSDELDLCFFG